MPNYDVTPKDSSVNPGVRLYGDSMQPIARGQTQQTERYAVQEGAPPASSTTGLEPGQVQLRGVWLGADAKALRDRLAEMLNDPGTTEVTVDAVDSGGNSVASEVDGDYRIGGEANSVDRVAPDSEAAYEYTLTLIEL